MCHVDELLKLAKQLENNYGKADVDGFEDDGFGGAHDAARDAVADGEGRALRHFYKTRSAVVA
ncbi:MAG: hypothetical protein AB7V13_13365 [Pseudorhodoplanes sp.]